MEQPRPSALATSGLWAGFVKRVHAHRAYLRGKELYTERQFAEAREPLAEAVALDGDHDDARALLGWTEYALGNYRAAIVDFKTVLRRQPSWEGPYDGLGWSRLRLGRFVLAADAFRAALDRDPGYTDAAIGLGDGRVRAKPVPGGARASHPSAPGAPEPQGRCLRQASVAAKIAWSLYYLERPAEALPASGAPSRWRRTGPDSTVASGGPCSAWGVVTKRGCRSSVRSRSSPASPTRRRD